MRRRRPDDLRHQGQRTIAVPVAQAYSRWAGGRVQGANPCPCGHAGDALGRCRCSPERIRAYRGRLSGPLLDRIDLHLVLPPVTLEQLHASTSGESSARVRERVVGARALQAERSRRGTTTVTINAALQGRDLDRVSVPDATATSLLRTAIDRLGLSARGYAKVRRIARTIADLEGSDAVRAAHFAEALQCRSLDHPLGEPGALAA
jgi:magnesium chelatase family protein